MTELDYIIVFARLNSFRREVYTLYTGEDGSYGLKSFEYCIN